MAIDSNKVNNARTPTQTNNMVSNRQFGSHSSFSMPDRPADLSEGQILHGEITDLRNNEVTFTLTDNTTIIGHITDSSNLYIGQTTSFRITDITAQKISLECLVNNFSNRQNITILKALEEAGLEKTERNLQLVEELLTYRMPINRQMLQQMTQQLAAIKGTSISTLVIMNKYNLPISPEMAQQFECYRTGDHSLLQGIDSISEELPALMEALSENAGSSDVAVFGGKLMSIITDHINASARTDVSLNATVLSAPERNILINFINNTNESSPQTLADSYTPAGLTSMTASIADGSAPLNDVTELFNMIRNDSPDIQGIADRLDTASDYISSNNHGISRIFNDSERSELIQQLSDLKLSPELLSNIRSGHASEEQVFTAINNRMADTAHINGNTVSDLFSSEHFQKLFRHVIKNIWTLSPRDLKQDDRIQDYYRQLIDDITRTTKLIENNLSGADAEVITRQADNMNDNVRFMQQLNQMFSFVQLPLRLHDQDIHSDLYVYTKKDELKQHPDKVSVLLHLDLNNIGVLDIHIAKNGTHVNAGFFCPDEFSANLLQNNIHMLNDTLNEQGYSFEANITRTAKKTDIVDEFISQHTGGSASARTNITRYAFDIRA